MFVVCVACGGRMWGDGTVWCGDCLADYRQISGGDAGVAVSVGHSSSGREVVMEGSYIEDRPAFEDDMFRFVDAVRRASEFDDAAAGTARHLAVELFGSSDQLDAWIAVDSLAARTDDGAYVLRVFRTAVDDAVSLGILR